MVKLIALDLDGTLMSADHMTVTQKTKEALRLAHDRGLDCFEPKGAFYVFPCIKSTGLSSDEFCERLIKEKHVAVVPGNAFGDCGEGYIRASYCYSIDNIKDAISRIGEFVKELKNENSN